MPPARRVLALALAAAALAGAGAGTASAGDDGPRVRRASRGEAPVAARGDRPASGERRCDEGSVPVERAGRRVGCRRTMRVTRARRAARVREIPVSPEPGATGAAGSPAAGGVVVVALDATRGGPERQALLTVGVPNQLVAGVAEAVAQAPEVIVVAGTAAAGLLTAGDVVLLQGYAKAGGTVVFEALTDPALRELAGVGRVAESDRRTTLTFAEGGRAPLGEVGPEGMRVVALDDVGSPGGATLGTVGYVAADLAGDATALATFEDGSAAVVRREYGDGVVYTVGARLLDLVERHLESARMSVSRSSANRGGWDADVWRLFLRGVYRETAPGGITLAGAPDGARFAVIPTLSANWGRTLTDGTTVAYVLRLMKAGAPPTVFIDTHYVADWLDEPFFTTEPGTFGAMLQKLAEAQGGADGPSPEVASESVSHSPVFNRLPVGTGDESYAGGYTPVVESRDTTSGATLLGELRVSRQLLESSFDPPLAVTSFRAPYLLTSPQLAPAEDAAGYRYDSSTTQGRVQSAFPFHPPRFDARGHARVTSFPIVIEDEEGDRWNPGYPRFDERIGQAVELIRQNGAYGAPSVILVHPNPSRAKLAAYVKLVTELGEGAWIVPLSTFGRFWDQRGAVNLSTAPSPACSGGRTVTLTSTPALKEVAEGLTVDVADPAMRIAVVDGQKREIQDGRLVMPPVKPGAAASAEVCPG